MPFLAKEGTKVAVADILDDKGRELIKKIIQSGGVAKFWHHYLVVNLVKLMVLPAHIINV